MPVFAEVDPNQKERIIGVLRKRGRVVGFLGAGINDAPALHAADAGISVDSAADVARDAATFVLLRRDLGVLAEGIRLGRRTFANALKYILTTTSANFGMFSMAGASVFLAFLPLTAQQILLNNFLSDLPRMANASDRVDDDWVARPRRWDMHFLRDFMAVFGLVSSVFDFLTFGILLHWLRAAAPEFRTAWFAESLWTELAVALIVRTRQVAWNSRPGHWLRRTTAATGAASLLLAMLPAGGIFGFVPLSPGVLAAIAGLLVSYVLADEAAKRLFYRRYPFG